MPFELFHTIVWISTFSEFFIIWWLLLHLYLLFRLSTNLVFVSAVALMFTFFAFCFSFCISDLLVLVYGHSTYICSICWKRTLPMKSHVQFSLKVSYKTVPYVSSLKYKSSGSVHIIFILWCIGHRLFTWSLEFARWALEENWMMQKISWKVYR